MAKMLQPAAPSLWVVICPLTSMTTILTAAAGEKHVTQNRTCWPVSATGPLSNQILGHTRLNNTSTAAIGELTLNYHDLSPLLSLKQVLKLAKQMMCRCHAALNGKRSPQGAGV